MPRPRTPARFSLVNLATVQCCQRAGTFHCAAPGWCDAPLSGETQMPNTNRIMTFFGWTFAVAALLWQPAVSKAADASQPTAFVMLPGSDELMGGAHYLLNLTNPTEQKQWPVLKSYFEVFLIGVDSKLPTRVGVVFGKKADRYIWSVPVAKLSKFRKDNVASIITPHIKEVGNNLFKLGNGRASRLQRLHALYGSLCPYRRDTERRHRRPGRPAIGAAAPVGEALPGCRRVRQPADRRRLANQAARTLPDDAEAVAGSPEEAEGRNAGRFRSAQESPRDRTRRGRVVLLREPAHSLGPDPRSRSRGPAGSISR